MPSCTGGTSRRCYRNRRGKPAALAAPAPLPAGAACRAGRSGPLPAMMPAISAAPTTTARPTAPTGKNRFMFSTSLSQPTGVGFEAHQILADRLEMLLPPLQLLRHAVDVAEAALERVLVEDRRRARRLIEDIDHLQRGVDREGRGEADRHPLVERQMTARRDRRGGRLERAEQPVPRRRKTRLGPRDLRLDHIVVAHRVARAARDLVARQLDEMAEHGAPDPKGDAGKTHRVE